MLSDRDKCFATYRETVWRVFFFRNRRKRQHLIGAILTRTDKEKTTVFVLFRSIIRRETKFDRLVVYIKTGNIFSRFVSKFENENPCSSIRLRNLSSSIRWKAAGSDILRVVGQRQIVLKMICVSMISMMKELINCRPEKRRKRWCSSK